MAWNGYWICAAADPIEAQFVSLADYQGYLDTGLYFPAFQYATAPIADADLILDLVPLDPLKRWAAEAGVTRTQEMAKVDVIWAYLTALGYAAVDGVVVIAIHDFAGDTAGAESAYIVGSGFLNGHPGTTTVTLGGTPCTSVVVVDNNRVNFTTPAHAAGVVDLVITNGNGAFTLVAAGTYA